MGHRLGQQLNSLVRETKKNLHMDSAGWEPAKIAKALANMLVKKNRDATAQAADVAEAPVA